MIADERPFAGRRRRQGSGRAHLAPEEVLEKLDSLSAEDKIRLRLIELRRRGGTDFKEGLLYQEAVCQAVLGERRCPRDESFVAFLAQSMRSVASHRRAQLKRQKSASMDKARWFWQRVIEMQIASDQLRSRGRAY